jgi:hypothetical protein
MPVGRVTVARQGKTFKEIYVVPSGFQNGLEEVLIVVQGEHQAIPEQIETSSSTGMFMMNPPPATAAGEKANPGVVSTDADRMREQYKEVGEAQGHAFGEGGPGARPPNFNLRVEQPKAAAAPTGTGTQAGASTGAPSATGRDYTSRRLLRRLPRVRFLGRLRLVLLLLRRVRVGSRSCPGLSLLLSRRMLRGRGLLVARLPVCSV